MSYSDTPEQAAIIGWSGHRLVVRAFAGTGKTSTLVRYALANPNSRMLYLAYNRAVSVAVTRARNTLVINALLQALLDEDAGDDMEGDMAAC